MSSTSDPYLAIEQLGLLQRQAGVDPETAALVVAHARLCADAGRPFEFGTQRFEAGSPEEKLLFQLRDDNPRIDARFLAFLAAYGGAMSRRGLAPLFGADHLARQVFVTPAHLRYVCRNSRSAYDRWEIPKRDGSMRVIMSPRQPLRRIQGWIKRQILDAAHPEDPAHGFVQGRSIATNASLHAGRRLVLRLDIEGFFPSITHRQVRRAFQKLGYSYPVAGTLANLCTVEGRLVQGAPTSPALSNLVCRRLDRRVSGLAAKLAFTYSRYADDLVLSSDDSRLPSLIPWLTRILEEEGFRLNASKTRIMRRGSRQTVTGLVVNRVPHLERSHVRRIRAAVHRLRTSGADAIHSPGTDAGGGDPLRVLQGHVAFLAMVDPGKGRRLMKALDESVHERSGLA